jgi:hypothetical protein
VLRTPQFVYISFCSFLTRKSTPRLLFFISASCGEISVYHTKMAPKTIEKQQSSLQDAYLLQLKQLAMGEHFLSRYVPVLILVFEALLCSAIIYFIPCIFPLPFPYQTSPSHYPKLIHPLSRRHRNRLGSIHVADLAIRARRARLHSNQGRDWPPGLSRSTCLDLLCVVVGDGPRTRYLGCAEDIWSFIFRHVGLGFGVL